MNRTSKRPQLFSIPADRRRFFKSMAMATAGFTLRGSLAEALTITPQQTQGPYYPSHAPYNNIPLDKDNDLLYLNDSLTPASGTITYIQGRVLDSQGNPIRGALIELWHADTNGNYIYSTTATRNPLADPNFAGFGQFLTGTTGAFLFRTIKASLYTGRTRPFSLSAASAVDRNLYTATTKGPLDLYLDQKATKGYYYISFRVPGADTGTPGKGAAGSPAGGSGTFLP